MKIKDRIKELRRVKASELMPNPKNWRTHPATQSSALKGMLADVGFADAVIARETPDGLMLIDGHLRTEVVADDEIPVLVVDLTEEEADKVLATLDPLAAMAETDSDILSALTIGLKFPNEYIEDMISGTIDLLPPPEPPEGFESFDDDMETQFKCPKCSYEWG